MNQFYTRKQEEENMLSQDTFGYFLDLSDFVFVSKSKKGNFDIVTHSLSVQFEFDLDFLVLIPPTKK